MLALILKVTANETSRKEHNSRLVQLANLENEEHGKCSTADTHHNHAHHQAHHATANAGAVLPLPQPKIINGPTRNSN